MPGRRNARPRTLAQKESDYAAMMVRTRRQLVISAPGLATSAACQVTSRELAIRRNNNSGPPSKGGTAPLPLATGA